MHRCVSEFIHCLNLFLYFCLKNKQIFSLPLIVICFFSPSYLPHFTFFCSFAPLVQSSWFLATCSCHKLHCFEYLENWARQTHSYCGTLLGSWHCWLCCLIHILPRRGRGDHPLFSCFVGWYNGEDVRTASLTRTATASNAVGASRLAVPASSPLYQRTTTWEGFGCRPTFYRSDDILIFSQI